MAKQPHQPTFHVNLKPMDRLEDHVPALATAPSIPDAESLAITIPDVVWAEIGTLLSSVIGPVFGPMLLSLIKSIFAKHPAPTPAPAPPVPTS